MLLAVRHDPVCPVAKSRQHSTDFILHAHKGSTNVTQNTYRLIESSASLHFNAHDSVSESS